MRDSDLILVRTTGVHGLCSRELLNMQGRDLFTSEVTDAGLVHLSGLHALHHLDLSNCNQLTDAGLVHLSGLRNLRHLDLSDNNEFTNAGLARVSSNGKYPAHTFVGFRDTIASKGGPKIVELAFPGLGCLRIPVKFYADRRIRTNSTPDFDLVEENHAQFWTSSLGDDYAQGACRKLKCEIRPISALRGPHALRLNTGEVDRKRPKLLLAIDILFEVKLFALSKSAAAEFGTPNPIIDPNHHAREQLEQMDSRVPKFSKHTIITTQAAPRVRSEVAAKLRHGRPEDCVKRISKRRLSLRQTSRRASLTSMTSVEDEIDTMDTDDDERAESEPEDNGKTDLSFELDPAWEDFKFEDDPKPHEPKSGNFSWNAPEPTRELTISDNPFFEDKDKELFLCTPPSSSRKFLEDEPAFTRSDSIPRALRYSNFDDSTSTSSKLEDGLFHALERHDGNPIVFGTDFVLLPRNVSLPKLISPDFSELDTLFPIRPHFSFLTEAHHPEPC
eukprot:g32181.t1